ncbi:hypothetical protein GCM10027060_05030 [Nesterenkonia halophila]|uniref:DUF3710 domain-containing protein n=1 Tax=Nesterenkonia halophila TaxID=302044 RepID=UPI0012913D09|nr:DUF3710 domain-containing protein [Nesterenkonia halophila]
MIFGRRKKSREAERQAERAAVGEARSGEAAREEPGTADAETAGATESPAAGVVLDAAESAASAEDPPQEVAEKAPEQPAESSDEAADAASGPFDVEEVESTKGYLDFGALLIPASKDQKVRLDIDQKTRRVVALTIAAGRASIQVQPFSAPKSGGTWDEVREQIQDSVVQQKGKVKQVDGRFGKEIAARVPTTLKDGRSGWRVARFIGFEGPRWFLRGVVGGRGAIDPKAAREVEELFARIVVVRGEEPMPPRELLPLNPPEGAKRVPVPRNSAQQRATGAGPNPAAASVGQGGAVGDDGRSVDATDSGRRPDDAAGR